MSKGVFRERLKASNLWERIGGEKYKSLSVDTVVTNLLITTRNRPLGPSPKSRGPSPRYQAPLEPVKEEDFSTISIPPPALTTSSSVRPFQRRPGSTSSSTTEQISISIASGTTQGGKYGSLDSKDEPPAK